MVPVVTLTMGTVGEGISVKVAVKRMGASVAIVGGMPVAEGITSVVNVGEATSTGNVAVPAESVCAIAVNVPG